MRMRPITVLAAALALLAAAPRCARAQTPTPTPTATSTASATQKSRPKEVQRVYDDYSRDGVIDVCAHTEATLKKTLDTIEASFDQDYPDFRVAVEAGIEKHKAGQCATQSSSGSSGSSGAAGAGAGAGAAAGSSTPTPAPTADAGPAQGAESGQLPRSSRGGAGSGAVPPSDRIPPPATATPAAPAITPVPQATVPPPAATATPQPQVVHAGHRSLTMPLILIAIALLGALALAASALLGRRNPRVAHAWREAAFRTRGTWADFSDWLRLGR